MPSRARTGDGVRTHAILGQVVASVFGDLRLSASLVEVPSDGGVWIWYPLQVLPDVSAFEIANNAERRRERSNLEGVERARQTMDVVVVETGGLLDLFAPVSKADDAIALLIAGPFVTREQTSSDLLERFRELTGRHGRMSDAEFAHYVATSLRTTTFRGAEFAAFKSLVRTLAALLRGRSSVDRLAREIGAQRDKLVNVRYAERMWDAVRDMTSEPTWRGWHSPQRRRELEDMGLSAPPEYVLVGLLGATSATGDPLEQTLQRNAFQRASVELARKTGVLCGCVGDHGIVLLTAQSGVRRAESKLVEVGERASALARRHGLRLHLGIGRIAEASLPARYQAALSAAEQALSQGLGLVRGERHASGSSAGRLSELRRELARAVSDRPGALEPAFERYLEAVKVHCGYRRERMQAYLEAGLDRLDDAVRKTAVLDEKSFAELHAALERDASDAVTVEQLCDAYRRLIVDVEFALARPDTAQQDRSLRRAIAFIRDHLEEPLGLERVARVAGYASPYFCRLFAKSERTTFHKYVQHLRLERAKHLLGSTSLSAEQVGSASGFVSRVHFHRAFKAHFGFTPLDYRRQFELQPKTKTATRRATRTR